MTVSVSAVRLGDWLASCADALAGAGVEHARHEALLIAALATGRPLASIYAAPETRLSAGELEKLDRVAARRRAREPLSRIEGEREFWGRSFALSPATLDPRPDTETLVEAALGRIGARGLDGEPIRILDLGTGTGCIRVTLLAELPAATAVGADLSPAAIATASANALRHGVAGRARFVVSDWFAGIAGTFHMIVANPPYIRRSEIAALQPEVVRFDPALALDGGIDGLAAYRSILGGIGSRLEPDAELLLEVGFDGAEAVAKLILEAGLVADRGAIRVLADLAKQDRVVACTVRCAVQDEKSVGNLVASR